ncbi:MAG: UDP-2,3-diacylglucosamine pyrophosphatase [Robiginitomaculum sp.]|nr:MAG: UDP-2,3-diacylglucosamine pyrophosphatase [Robiginitomaculum sp.]
MGEAGKIGLIAGGGALPHDVIRAAKHQGYDVFVAALRGFVEPEDFAVPADAFGFGELRGLIKRFKQENCTHVTMVGTVSRPDFSTIKPGIRDLPLLAKIISAATKGDDALLKFMVSLFEKEGFTILAPQDVLGSSLMETGVLGKIQPSSSQHKDIDKALHIAALIGAQDIGQGAVVHKGLVLAVEAQEGTDKMLERVANLPVEIRGGVLAKCLKPGQEERVDLPTIGIKTVELAAAAGLTGIVLVAGKAFVMERSNVRALADKYGIFVYGVKPEGSHD